MTEFDYDVENCSNLLTASGMSLLDEDDPLFQGVLDLITTSAAAPETNAELPDHSIHVLEMSSFGQDHEFSDASSTP